MKTKPPALLVAVAVIYFGYLAWQLASSFAPVIVGRSAVAIALFFFVFRGSRVAGNIVAVLCAISSLLLLVTAIRPENTNLQVILLFVIGAGLLAAFAAYMLFSPAVRAFQGVLSKAPAA